MRHPFAKYTPSIFVICSPYQLLCALEAIHHFEIKKYRVYTVFYKGDPRNEQLERTLKAFNIKYYGLSNIITQWEHRQTFLPRFNKYKRGFIGDFRNYTLLHHCMRFISNNSTIISLDDGMCTVSALNGSYKHNNTPLENRLLQICSWRNILLGKYFFTQFSDIKNQHLEIAGNDFNYFKEINKNKKGEKGVVFIGTNPDSYINNYTGVSVEDFSHYLNTILKSIRNKYPNESIYYYAHPRDINTFALDFCKNYGIVFKKAEIGVEIDVLLSEYRPKCVYGFNSTGLYNIKKIYPTCEVVSLILPHKCDYSMTSFCEYIKQNNIQIKTIGANI